jgi:N-acetylated-alpha-linked acidic dipeptidase
MDYGRFADTVEKYVKELTTLLDTMRTQTQDTNLALADGSWAATLDPRKHLLPPPAKAAVPATVNLKPLIDAVARLKESLKGSRPSDDKLVQAERCLLGPGLPGRPWYRHTIYAPGLYTGYGVKTLPGVREAIEQRQWTEAETQAQIAGDALDRLTALLK